MKNLVSGIVLVGMFLLPPASAHDGGFGHSRRTIYLESRTGELVLEYRIMQNRDDALLEMTLMDADKDGQVSTEERDNYFQERARRLAGNLSCRRTDGEALPLKFVRYELNHSLVQVFQFTIATSATEVLLDDRNFPHKPGLVQIRHAPGLTVELARTVNLTHAERVNLRIKRLTPASNPPQAKE